jgi:hypothetical protein
MVGELIATTGEKPMKFRPGDNICGPEQLQNLTMADRYEEGTFQLPTVSLSSCRSLRLPSPRFRRGQTSLIDLAASIVFLAEI